MKQGDNALLEMKGVNKTFCIRSKKLVKSRNAYMRLAILILKSSVVRR